MGSFKSAAVTLGVLVPLVGASAAVAETVSKTFSYTGAEQTFAVPAGVTSVHVVATGAAGGRSNEGAPPIAAGGRGAVVSGNLSVPQARPSMLRWADSIDTPAARGRDAT